MAISWLQATILLASIAISSGVFGADISPLTVKFDKNLGIGFTEDGLFDERSTVGVRNGNYYYGTGEGKFYIISKTGRTICSYTTRGYNHSNIVFTSDDTAHFVSGDYYFYALRPDCTLKWKIPVYAYGSSVGVGPGDMVYATGGEYLYAVNASGQQQWSVYVGPWVEIGAVGKDGTLYVSSQDNYLRAYAPDGTMKWAYHARSLPRITGAPSNGVLVASSSYPAAWIVGINPSDGNLIWEKPLYNGHGTSAVVYQNIVYIVDGKYLRAKKLSNGAAIWSKLYDNTLQDVDTSNTRLVRGQDGILYFTTEQYGPSIIRAFDLAGTPVGILISAVDIIDSRNAAPKAGVFAITEDHHLKILAAH